MIFSLRRQCPAIVVPPPAVRLPAQVWFKKNLDLIMKLHLMYSFYKPQRALPNPSVHRFPMANPLRAMAKMSIPPNFVKVAAPIPMAATTTATS